jgi:hypothetical protein
MKRTAISLLPVFAVLYAVLFLTNCRKKNDGPSETRRNLTGSWRITALGVDANGNNALDLDEFVPAPESPALVMTFAENGTGNASVNVNGFPLNATTTWELSNSDRNLKVVSSVSGFSMTQYYSITTITTSALILADTSTAQRSFTVAQKL